ncbi:LysM domain-containing protein [Penicillium rolfsii]|nr:LysM domain-containing protein [Penicillium rolfsii]
MANPHLYRRQDGPVDPGTASDCTWYDTARDSTYTCEWFELNWGLSHEDFVSYNPSVLDDCSGIKVGNSYCVEANNGQPRPTTTSSTPTSTATPKPSPTQDGLIDTCKAFYLAVAGDTCDKIVAKYGGTFATADFIAWNPAVGSDCSGIWAKTYYCVGVPGTPTGNPSTTTPTGGPSPTQDGIISTCSRFYQAVAGDTCDKIAAKYGTFSTADFIAWNPAVGEFCSGLQVGYYYCVGIPSTPTTTTTPTGPAPTQTGIISTCNRYHKAVDGDSCAGIVKQYGTFTLDQFLAWNSAVGADCGGLWLGYYYCIGVPGTATKPTTTTTTTTTAGCTSAPTPTQPGAVCACKQWHKVVSGNTCDTIQKQYGITAANFNMWNPQVGTNCASLWLGYYVCVGA